MSTNQRKTRSRKLTEFMTPKSRASEEPREPQPQPKESGQQERQETGIDEIKEIILRKTRAAQKSSRDAVNRETVETPVQDNVNGKIMSTIEAIAASSHVRIVECDQQGVCNDGRRIGEVFTDEYGLKRQRGFINTTRLPIFLDFIVEEAEANPVLKKAYVVRTARGSLALVPDDFICELNSRYGIIVSSMDKCVNYRSNPWRERNRAPRKK